jgi:hypothetical protein
MKNNLDAGVQIAPAESCRETCRKCCREPRQVSRQALVPVPPVGFGFGARILPTPGVRRVWWGWSLTTPLSAFANRRWWSMTIGGRWRGVGREAEEKWRGGIGTREGRKKKRSEIKIKTTTTAGGGSGGVAGWGIQAGPGIPGWHGGGVLGMSGGVVAVARRVAPAGGDRLLSGSSFGESGQESCGWRRPVCGWPSEKGDGPLRLGKEAVTEKAVRARLYRVSLRTWRGVAWVSPAAGQARHEVLRHGDLNCGCSVAPEPELGAPRLLHHRGVSGVAAALIAGGVGPTESRSPPSKSRASRVHPALPTSAAGTHVRDTPAQTTTDNDWRQQCAR